MECFFLKGLLKSAQVLRELPICTVQEADMVIEAAVERLDIKQSIFAELERVCRPDCVLSSNTSTINLDLISAKMRNRDRVVGAHFFSPAHVMPLLEIVRTDHSSAQV
jgi:enoyl-CoA hydratase/3-hydroxyacyl-CoA dehydrogenase